MRIIEKDKWNYFCKHYKELGYKLEPEHNYYYQNLGSNKEIFIWKTKDNSLFIPRVMYIEVDYKIDYLRSENFLLNLTKEIDDIEF